MQDQNGLPKGKDGRRVKYRLSKKLTENLGLKIMALFFAALLWLVVVNYDDPVDTQLYRNISVSVKNEDVITSGGKTYQILDQTEVVSVTVKAKRSILSKIKPDDIVATADFNDMELVSLVPITVSILGHENDNTSATANPHNLQVKVEDVEKKNYPLTVSTTGTLRDGYVLGTTTTNPESITIGGSESLVNSIDKAVARINISGMSESGSVEADLVLYDTEGNVIDQTLLSNNLGEKGLTVDVEILGTKDLPISATTSGTPAENYVYGGLSYTPETVKVYGTPEELDEIDEIVIPATQIDISGLTEKKDFAVDISQYLPEKVSLVEDGDAKVIITVAINASDSKTIELPVESIAVSNLKDGLKLDYVTTDNLQLQFQGPQDVLNKLDVKTGAYMDLKDYTTAGEYEVAVTVETPSGVTMISNPVVKIKLSNKG